jgi:beta-lactam-binding protein with PASTA domain
MKKILLISLLAIITTGCTEFAILMSGSSIAISQNTYARAYNAADMLTIMGTQKSIKKHAYEKGKKYLVDWTKAKALGIMTKH